MYHTREVSDHKSPLIYPSIEVRGIDEPLSAATRIAEIIALPLTTVRGFLLTNFVQYRRCILVDWDCADFGLVLARCYFRVSKLSQR
jgi:hypothetical protein